MQRVLSGKAAEVLLHQLKVMPDLLLMLRQFHANDVACAVCMNAMWSLSATGSYLPTYHSAAVIVSR